MRMRTNKSGISMPINVNVRYPPGTPGFDINGIPPKTYTSLVGGDIVNFSVPASFK